MAVKRQLIRGMSRPNSLGIFLLSIGMAYLLFLFGYIISPMYAHITISHDGLLDWVVKSSKILLWSGAGSLIVSILVLMGAFNKRYALTVNTLSIYLLAAIAFSAIVSVTLILLPAI